MGTHSEKENTYSNLPPDQKIAAIEKEMTPYFIYAAVPIIITIIIALVFGPSLT